LKTTKPPITSCPYWDQITKQDCKMTRGGLYIPLPEHIEIFCLTSHFIQCHQYIRGKELQLDEAAATDKIYEDSRRRHRRIKESLPISIAPCDSLGRQISDLAEETMTVDLSIGGICLKSNKEFITNDLLLLNLMEKTTGPPLSGIGEVKWCNSIKDSSEYLVGLAFKTSETGRAVGQYLGVAGA
jgi:Tfp pilus assembly protein PilZ